MYIVMYILSISQPLRGSLRRQLGFQLLQPIQYDDHAGALLGARVLDHQEPLAIRGDVVSATGRGVEIPRVEQRRPGWRR